MSWIEQMCGWLSDGLGVLPAAFGNELQGDVAVKPGVLGPPHLAHAAFADLLDEAVVQQLLSGFDRHPALLGTGPRV